MARTSQIAKEKPARPDNGLLLSLSDDDLAKELYPSPFNSRSSADDDDDDPQGRDQPRPIPELKMSSLSDAIRQKPDWRTKCFDLAITHKWIQEAVDQDSSSRPQQRLTREMCDYVLKEVQQLATWPEADGQPGPWERIWRADSTVPEEVKDALLQQVAKLEAAEIKDWHPNTNQQVLNLIHPSLYPVIYNQSYVNNDLTAPYALPLQSIAHDYVSMRFQWLPSVFAVDQAGNIELKSPYINNLHLENTDMQQVICQVLSKAVPLFERVLSDLRRPLLPVRFTTSNARDWSDPTKPLAVPCVWNHADIPYNENEEEDQEAFFEKQPQYFLEVNEYADLWSAVDKTVSLRNTNINVIVKMANILLTPEQPEYAGGTWHLEAMENERIVSTAIYYYDEENITASSLAFRTGVAAPIYHQQDDGYCTRMRYNIDRDDALIQDRNSILTKQDRIIAFPNVYQHCVAPFKLEDPSKPGHRKIMAFFLIDPGHSLATASDIAPAQRSIILEAVSESRLAKILPTEILQKIVDMVPGTMSHEEALKVRLELMEERTRIDGAVQGTSFDGTFNLCEH